MKKFPWVAPLTLFLALIGFQQHIFSQNKVGLGTVNPEARLHIKGVDNISQLCIDADTNQTNLNPMIRLRKSDGTDLMWIHTNITENIFMGLNSGKSITNGWYNTAIGKNALSDNTTGSYNSAFGPNALSKNISGTSNTAMGSATLLNNTTGNNNTATGQAALSSNTGGNDNTAIGNGTLNNNTTGGNNTAVGALALNSNTTGDDNTAIGRSTLNHNATGIRNTALGGAALTFNTNGQRNTGCGHYALHFNSIGNYNSAIGNEALYNNTTGAGNSAFGYQTLYNNTTQIQNTAFGNESLLNTTANGNTAVGFLAGHDFDNGDHNTYLGIYADANDAGFTNSTAIGSSRDITASNQVRIGFAVSSIGGPQNWTNTSDRRIKLNVRADVPGLAFINILQPVTYNKSIALEGEIIAKKRVNVTSPDNPYEKIRYSGFIAQEVEAAAQSISYEFSGVDAPQNDKSLYGLRYAEFVVPLVKAVQELSQEVEQLKKENGELKKLILKTQ